MINLHESKDRQAAIAATTDAATRDELVVKYMPLVHYVVRSLALSLPPMLDTEDVVSYGVMGLIDAIDRFDATRGVKFETYAVTRIRGYIIDQLRTLDWIPRSARQPARPIERAHDAMERESGGAPSRLRPGRPAEHPIPLLLPLARGGGLARPRARRRPWTDGAQGSMMGKNGWWPAVARSHVACSVDISTS